MADDLRPVVGSLISALIEEARDNDQTYRIGELAAEFNLTLRTLRFYEDRGLLKPTRRSTTRLYSARDRRRLQLVLLWKQFGFTIGEAIEFVQLVEDPKRRGTRVAVALKLLDEQMPVVLERKREAEDAVDAVKTAQAFLRRNVGTKCG